MTGSWVCDISLCRTLFLTQSAGYLFRATSGGIMRVAGLAPVQEIPGLENIDVTKLVNGHMAYRSAMPRLLREVGWEVESDEFTEIEDPDPDNHEKRQRKLIRELDEARKEAEAKPEKKRFGFFKRSKLAEKKGWETYDDRSRDEVGPSVHGEERGISKVLFDVDAIRAELASEQIEVKQLESTLPPMKLNLNGMRPSADNSSRSPYSNLRETKSFDNASMMRDLPADNAVSNTSLQNGRVTGASSPSIKGYEEHKEDEDHKPQTYGESDVRMTFESSYESPPRSTASPRLPSTPFSDRPPEGTSSPSVAAPVQRPGLRPSATMPTGISGLSLEHNAWADDEDDFGKEKDIKMTFA